MKPSRWFVVLAVLTLLLGAARADAAVIVAATTPDLAAIARHVGGPHVEVSSLALPTQDPHFVDACSSDACQQMCFSAHPHGISDLYLLTDCAASSCDSQCPGNTVVDLCSKCIFEDCSSQINTCLGDPECLALYTCLSNCGNNDLVCQKGCYMAHGGAVPELQAVLDCSAAKCPGLCGQ